METDEPVLTSIPAPALSASTPSTPNKADPPQEIALRPSYAEVAAEKSSRSLDGPTKKNACSTSKPTLQTILKRIERIEDKIEPPKTQSTPTKMDKQPGRDRCLILFNVPESSKESIADRILDDRFLLQSLVSKLFDPGENGLHILQAYRLGQENQSSELPRPLKIVLESPDECKRVFSRVHRLKGDPLHIQRDLSPEDRWKMKQALLELRRRRDAGENDLRFVNFRVVKRLPRTAWKPLIIYPVASEDQE